ncbi:MAG: L-threonylcarbamoyladenylate synthase [Spirochaetaceae bacterium]|jgi:L-threonylcarbamoyladenylate synthase|nr:L-threonylcarbamoyladenylate synthase [Spirochaetaceae bacterium]
MMEALIIKKSRGDSIEITLEALRAKECVVLPTDTIYGLSGIVPDTEPLIQHIKGRDAPGEGPKPLIRLIAAPEDIFRYTGASIPRTLLEKWPGPLSVIVPLADAAAQAEGRSGGVPCAFRCPGDPWLREVIARLGAPVFSTSANRTGRPPLGDALSIWKEFSLEAALIVDGGEAPESVPSTIVEVTEGGYRLIRPGAVRVS